MRRRCSSFGMRVPNCVHASSPFAIRPPSSSSPLCGQDCRDAYDGGERSSSLNPGGRALPSSSPYSLQSPSVDDRDRLDATCRESCDDGAGRSSASSSAWRCHRATSGSRSGLPAAPSRGSRSRGFAVSASILPFVQGTSRFLFPRLLLASLSRHPQGTYLIPVEEETLHPACLGEPLHASRSAM